MVDGVDTSDTARTQSSAAEAWERSDSLVRIRWTAERRRIDTTRIGRSMIGFAALWALVPVVEAIAGGLSIPALVLHFGVVMPWAVIVGVGVGINRASARADVAAGLVVLTACFVTLISHRIGGSEALRAFDTLALLPLLQFCVSTRPRRAGRRAGGRRRTGDLRRGSGPRRAGLARSDRAGGGRGRCAALGAGLFHEAELAQSHWRRVEAEVAAHRLIHRADELRVLSEVDPLTGLANRRSIEMRLSALGERAAYGPETVAVMMIDVDCFKQFNDHFASSRRRPLPDAGRAGDRRSDRLAATISSAGSVARSSWPCCRAPISRSPNRSASASAPVSGMQSVKDPPSMVIRVPRSESCLRVINEK